MLYFFYGADTYRLRQKINSVIGQYQAKHSSGLNLGKFDLAQEGEFAKLKDFLGAYSMFAEKKLAVAGNALEVDMPDDFLNHLSADKESFLFLNQSLVLSEERKTKSKYLFKGKNTSAIFEKLRKYAVNEEFDLLSGAKLENWLKKEIANKGSQIEPAAVKKLILFVGADLWRLANETDKAGKLIIVQDVDSLVGAEVVSDIFKTVDALGQRQKALAFKLLHQHLEQGESEIYLFSMLAYQFRNLLLVKDQLERGAQFNALAAKLKIHPFVLRKSFDQAKNFSLSALKKIYSRLAEIDIQIKSGRIEPRVALDLVAQEIAG